MKNVTGKYFWVMVGVLLALGLSLAAGGLRGGQAAGLSLDSGSSVDTALGPEFTYQGKLLKDNQPVTGSCDFQFRLYDAASAGNLLGGPLDRTGVAVNGGLFNVLLGFNSALYNGQALYLDINVRCPAGSGSYILLGRQPLSSVPYAQYSQNSNQLDGKEGAQYQARVNGACPPGRVMVAIGADGGAVCQADAPFNRASPPQGNSLVDVDAPTSGSAGVGASDSAAIGANGLPLIAYYDEDNQDLKVAACHDLPCSVAHITTIDTAKNTGLSISLSIGADGLGLISYYDGNLDTLKVAHCSDAECSSATLTTLDGGGTTSAGDGVATAIGPDGLGLIAYRYTTTPSVTYSIKVAHCSNPNCTAATFATVITPSYVQEVSLAVGADGLGLITYWDWTALKVIHCNDPLCTGASTPVTVDAAGMTNSITIGIDGLPLIAYADGTNNRLKVAHCPDVQCSTISAVTLEHIKISTSLSTTVGADGLGLIAYNDGANNDLRVAHCTDLACSTATFFTPDSAGITGANPSLTIGADGLPFISYSSTVSYKGRLRAAHCGSAFCTPFFGRR